MFGTPPFEVALAIVTPVVFGVIGLTLLVVRFIRRRGG